jgi:hypothetical protein
MAQTPWVSSAASLRLLVSPDGALAYMVADGSDVWSSPSQCPASWVTVFCTSMRTQPVSPGAVQGSPSTVVKVNFVPVAGGASFNSMSLSRISPVLRIDVVVVVAMTPSPCSQQS